MSTDVDALLSDIAAMSGRAKMAFRMVVDLGELPLRERPLSADTSRMVRRRLLSAESDLALAAQLLREENR